MVDSTTLTLAAPGGYKLEVIPASGGRVSSMIDPRGREWLWKRPDPSRDSARPGDPFIDVGGIEECFPTLGDVPDHGDVWARSWTIAERDAERLSLRVETRWGALERAIRCSGAEVSLTYRLRGRSGTRFVWACHMLLDLPIPSQIEIAPGMAYLRGARGEHSLHTWPEIAGQRFDMLPADDGSASFVLLPGRSGAVAWDGSTGLRIRVECADAPYAIGFWRNLGGYPSAAAPYRSIGIEPMLGHTIDPWDAKGDPATIPDSGQIEWSVVIDTVER